MNPGPLPYPTQWKSLYRAAFLETDHKLISQRVCEAQRAILALYDEHCTHEEIEALEDALYVLHAFRSALLSAEEAW